MLKVMMSKVMMWKMMMSYSGCFIWPGCVGMGSSTAITLIVSTDWLPCLPSFLLFSITFSSTLNFDCFSSIGFLSLCYPFSFMLIQSLLMNYVTNAVSFNILSTFVNHFNINTNLKFGLQMELIVFFSGVNCYSSFELKRNWPTRAGLIRLDLLFTWMHLDLFFAISSHI